jgi:hypothetical protein
MMTEKKKDNPYVSVGTCKIVTDALTEKIAAQKLLVDAEIKAIKTAIYASVTTLGLVLTVVEFALRYWRP